MAKIFVDANCFIGLANRIPEINSESLDSHQGFISALSCHILFYVNKIKIPHAELSSFIGNFNVINLDEKILTKSLVGPTQDLEDNIQLHSAAENDCEIFLTLDKKLLEMKFFGKTQIVSPENLKNLA